jgi:hypothetical protein
MDFECGDEQQQRGQQRGSEGLAKACFFLGRRQRRTGPRGRAGIPVFEKPRGDVALNSVDG